MGCVKHMAAPIAICHREIKLGHCEHKKTSGLLNPSDLGTKPLPASSFHRLSQWCQRQHFYPDTTTKHGCLMEVTQVNNPINEVKNDRATALIDLTLLKNIEEV